MFSSTVFNNTAGCFSPAADYHHPAQQQETTYSDILFSGHDSSISGCLFHYPNPLALLVHDIAEDDLVPTVCSTVIASCSVEKTPPMPAESGCVVASKKSDNRSKIRTSQGLRDRRVRLSIGTARKFFDLQDLLGFDKPSGTLEWLLKKSNKAILKLSAASSSSKTSSEAASRRVDATYSSNQAEGTSCGAALKTMKKEKALMAKESRAKARYRARARTVAKLCKAEINYQQIQLLKNQEDKMISRGNQTSYPNPNCHNVYSWPSTTKSLVILESHKEERKRLGKEHHLQEQKQHLMLHNYDSGTMKSNCWSGLNPNSILDHWDICNIFPQSSPSLAHHLNMSSDIDVNGRASWDYLLGNYTTL